MNLENLEKVDRSVLQRNAKYKTACRRSSGKLSTIQYTEEIDKGTYLGKIRKTFLVTLEDFHLSWESLSHTFP